MVWLKIISKIIKAFRSGESPGKIAGGFGMGFLIGLMPFLTLQGIVLFFILILVNINLAAATLAIFLASLFAYLLDPLFHAVGYWFLTMPALQGLWETLYNLPVAPLSRFNNTVVLGSFICGLILFIPVYFAIKYLVVGYRSGVEDRVKKWKIVQMISGSKLFQLYTKIRDLGGE